VLAFIIGVEREGGKDGGGGEGGKREGEKEAMVKQREMVATNGDGKGALIVE